MGFITLLKNFKGLYLGPVSGTFYVAPNLVKAGIVLAPGVSLSEQDSKTEELIDCGEAFPHGHNIFPGSVKFSFQLMVDSHDTLLTFKGGAVSEVGWQYKTSSIVSSARILADNGNSVEIPKATILSKFSGALGDNGQVILDVTIIPIQHYAPGVTIGLFFFNLYGDVYDPNS